MIPRLLIYASMHLKGGSKSEYGYNLRIWSRNAARPDYVSPSVGFRCVQ